MSMSVMITRLATAVGRLYIAIYNQDKMMNCISIKTNLATTLYEFTKQNREFYKKYTRQLGNFISSYIFNKTVNIISKSKCSLVQLLITKLHN